ncbi:specifically androgen-regulated gene protein [Denticeps clupeoides]|uniref:Specifically androgen-regulated gene protein n=1 Tax=Denticeps clupeoides TaxID=299321 RepID=A0AAY4EQ42_9TELE|nr:specifically androgen-regulated gene protein-like [Denticeps clupeoides]XP_028850815.1 specifically androgen-regulated gene protein-like [Denticeps clupeoides]XP_028850816.1 specifically androgen-regulated gene protein-like [Denticeps clupeoides]XP_028850817.1 specifically androgen-regulated gene protein-like [Denticeps clupeoides]
MPKTDIRGAISMETLSSTTSMNSVGSCDSVVSINSTYSDDSLEFLSAEERACLMFLEETIESLEAEDDSGLSTDETHLGSLSGKMANRASTAEQNGSRDGLRYHDSPNNSIGVDHKLNHMVPTPLVIINENLTKVNSSLNHGPTRHPSTTEKGTNGKPSSLEVTDTKTTVPSDVPKPNLSPGSSAVCSDCNSKSETVEDSSPSKHVVSETVELIPPPVDFMDNPLEDNPTKSSNPTGPSFQTAKNTQQTPKGLDKPTKDVHNMEPGAQQGLSPNDMEMLRKKVSLKKAPELTPAVQKHTSIQSFGDPLSSAGAFPEPPVEYSNPKSPPAVAAKPKKLPSNIILKSHKATESAYSVPLISPDKVLMDPQKVRLEALRKLGLLKTDEPDQSLTISPSLSPKSRRSWAGPPPPAFGFPGSPGVDSDKGHTSASEQPLENKRPKADLPTVAEGHARDLKSLSPSTAKQQLSKPPRKLVEVRLSSPEIRAVGRASEENVCGNRLAMGNSPASGGHLRHTLPRPASLDKAKDLRDGHTTLHHHAPDRDSEIKRLLPAAPCPELQPGPRSHGISVLISPHGQSGEDRKQALRKLGLLRD